jgi:SpoVK/Ycf46/Vps4 family AAA+-type ATPase
VRASLWHAARRHSSQSLSQLTTRVIKPHTWEHLVLPDTTLRRVREVASAIRQRDRVFHGWRMAERTGHGNGLMILFAGASGTGKTMTAAVIANGLGLELYRIDLASVVSKYIGETEKNLDRIFEAARRSNGILLFDEADALLGKRSEVKDAHDRYANIEVAYLLQKMEEHDGVVILATNLSKNLDQAFARRMHYVVDFPRPDKALRERLWLGMFPAETPLASDIDFRFLAEQFETSGGDIQTIALDAAFLASAENSAIHMSHVVEAMARHQLKQGNPASTTSFKQYYDMVRTG